MHRETVTAPNSEHMSKDYLIYEKTLNASYGAAAENYRRDDEIEIGTANHRRLCGNLGRISASFSHTIHVLDVGCGTGRHFHCLQNVESLIGIDISPAMLAAAASPVRSADVSARNIHLKRGNIYEQSFSPETFDLIYSLGVFGHGAKLTVDVGRKFYEWLRPGGRLYINTIETSVDRPVVAGKKQLKKILLPLLPGRMQAILQSREARLPVFTMTHDELDAVMRASGFADFTISANVCRSPLWSGVHLECIALKKSHSHEVSQRRTDSS